MIPKEQKESVMAAMGDRAGPGKVDPACVHSSDPILSWSQIAVTQACWPQAYKNRCEFQASCHLDWKLPKAMGRALPCRPHIQKLELRALDQAWPQLSPCLSLKWNSEGSNPRSSLNYSPKLPTCLSLLVETASHQVPMARGRGWGESGQVARTGYPVGLKPFHLKTDSSNK